MLCCVLYLSLLFVLFFYFFSVLVFSACHASTWLRCCWSTRTGAATRSISNVVCAGSPSRSEWRVGWLGTRGLSTAQYQYTVHCTIQLTVRSQCGHYPQSVIYTTVQSTIQSTVHRAYSLHTHPCVFPATSHVFTANVTGRRRAGTDGAPWLQCSIQGTRPLIKALSEKLFFCPSFCLIGTAVG